MAEFALLIDSQFKEIRDYAARPVDIPHKLVTWHPVVREYGVPFTGIENGDWVIRIVDPATLPPPVPRMITRRQCALQLRASGMISTAEAKAMVKDGTPPAAIKASFDAMPGENGTLAEIDFAAVNYYRDNPLISSLMAANGMTTEQVDDFFRAAALL